MNRILKCKGCGKYTLSKQCACGSEAVSPAPLRYSPEDKFGSYRRKAKEMLKANEHMES